jgi:hypothetical protein
MPRETESPAAPGTLTIEGHLRARLASAEAAIETLDRDLVRARHVADHYRTENQRLARELGTLRDQQTLIERLGRDNDRLRSELSKAHEQVRLDAAFEGAMRCAEKLAEELGHDDEPYVIEPYEPTGGAA